jgi:hypothetical protein
MSIIAIDSWYKNNDQCRDLSIILVLVKTRSVSEQLLTAANYYTYWSQIV